MIYSTDFFIAMRCPDCGRQMLYRNLSLFALSDGDEWEVTCSCHGVPCIVSLEDHKKLYLEVYGPCCDEAHQFIYDLTDFQSGEVYSLRCDIENLHLGYIGMREQVLTALSAEGMMLVEYADELGSYFADPKVMGHMLDVFNKQYARGAVSCSCCGCHDVNIELKHNTLELHCAECGAGGALSARYNSDRQALGEADLVLLKEDGVQLVKKKNSAKQAKPVTRTTKKL